MQSVNDRLSALEGTRLAQLQTGILQLVDDRLAAFEARMLDLLTAQFKLATDSAVQTMTATATTLQGEDRHTCFHFLLAPIDHRQDSS